MDKQSKATTVREVKGWLHKVCIIPGRLDGKLVIITGANTGIGETTTGEIARRGATVIMACRDFKRAQGARERLLNQYGVNNPDSLKKNVADPRVATSVSCISEDQLQIELLDLSSLNSVRQFAARIRERYEKLDYLINNAGLLKQTHSITEDGLETTVGVNHLGPFLLTQLLLPLMHTAEASCSSRIIFVSSMLHKFGELSKPSLHIPPERYTIMSAYCHSKLANVMCAKELASRLEGTGIVVVSLHPGAVKTEIARDITGGPERIGHFLFQPFLIDPWLGCQTTLYTVLAPVVKSGAYYDNCKEASPKSIVFNEKERKWLWKISCELVGLNPNE
ncbi:hypothetical protein T265_07291 [Opisthorchis viverrini]|uniref:Oxidoreductase, short chain dehydrogenase/reductase family protein n=1 Tax=Opisthorchis viverrini TaxID=6198 RepID=A0A074ZD47_OPIVI|nr:hypothetical protein T265_07291 [Opisthorchis viverrini]KER25186.1 hypothetical protein T265_07291 [Opisthorchis viverrini]